MSEFFVYPEDMSDHEETTEIFNTTLANDNLPKIENRSSYELPLNETKSLVQNQNNEEITKKTN